MNEKRKLLNLCLHGENIDLLERTVDSITWVELSIFQKAVRSSHNCKEKTAAQKTLGNCEYWTMGSRMSKR